MPYYFGTVLLITGLALFARGEESPHAVRLPGLSLAQEDIPQALKKTQEELAGDRNNPALLCYLAQVYCRSGVFEKAELTCAEALSRNPVLPEALVLSALLDASAARMDRATQRMKEALKTSTLSPMQLFWLAPVIQSLDSETQASTIRDTLKSAEKDDEVAAGIRHRMAWRTQLNNPEFYKIKPLDRPLLLPMKIKSDRVYIRAKLKDEEFWVGLDTGMGDLDLKSDRLKNIGKASETEVWKGDVNGWAFDEQRLLPALLLGDWHIRNVPVTKSIHNLIGLNPFSANNLCITLDMKNNTFIVDRKSVV